MANPEHLAILKKGMTAWNEWRKQNPDIRPDLSEANLSGGNLYRADFYGANLNRARLFVACLVGANLGEANLCEANLFGANLNKVSLCVATLVGANLNKASLCEADLSGANLSRTSLYGANLYGANLYEANLSRASLYGANLSGAKLYVANLSGAKLEDAGLQYSQLSQCNLTEAALTGARLYGSGRDDWIIKGVQCRYVFWDVNGVIRSPKDRDLAPGEFERLYRTLPTIEYVFEKGMSPMDPLIMDRVVQAIREQNPEFDIKIDSINARGVAPSVKFTVQREEHKEPALHMIVAGYESWLQHVEAEKDRLYDLLGRAIDQAGIKVIEAGPGAVVATDGSTINIEQHIHQAVELQKTITEQPEDSPTFAKVAKKTALDIIGSALKDVAKGEVKKAAARIIELGKNLGPVIVNTAAYAYFTSLLPGG